MINRPYSAEADWWAIRDLIIRTHQATPIGWNWDIRHWDGSRFHRAEAEQSRAVANGIGLWEADGRLVGAVLGAAMACVETGDMEPANALYRACGFSEEYRGHWWQRAFDSDAVPLGP